MQLGRQLGIHLSIFFFKVLLDLLTLFFVFYYFTRKLKNRVAAQTARDRKKARMSELEQQVLDLEMEVWSLLCLKLNIQYRSFIVARNIFSTMTGGHNLFLLKC